MRPNSEKKKKIYDSDVLFILICDQIANVHRSYVARFYLTVASQILLILDASKDTFSASHLFDHDEYL